MRITPAALTAAAALVAAAITHAAAPAVPTAAIHVRPSTGAPTTTFVVSFRVSQRTGTVGDVVRHDVVSGEAGSVHGGCLSTFQLPAPDAAAGTLEKVALSPARLGGELCPGRVRGRVFETRQAACRRGQACPLVIVVLGTVGRFSFTVTAPPTGPDTTPPTFAGLASAFACTPGPQRPGETTPFTLSWTAATDDRTPSSQIVYDIYLATSPGGEDYATPTWTTAPGVTSYRTPGLASHGTFYFVVRARDRAGNEDRNTVERRGIDPCE